MEEEAQATPVSAGVRGSQGPRTCSCLLSWISSMRSLPKSPPRNLYSHLELVQWAHRCGETAEPSSATKSPQGLELTHLQRLIHMWADTLKHAHTAGTHGHLYNLEVQISGDDRFKLILPCFLSMLPKCCRTSTTQGLCLKCPQQMNMLFLFCCFFSSIYSRAWFETRAYWFIRLNFVKLCSCTFTDFMISCTAMLQQLCALGCS